MIITYQLLFQDRDKHVRRTQISYDTPTSATIAALVGFLNGYRDAVQPLSNALCISGRLAVPPKRELGGTAGVGSNVYRSLVLFSLSNTGRAGHIQIPSPLPELVDSTGDFAGFRVLEAIPTIEAALSFYSAPTYPLVDDVGLPIGDKLEVGAIRFET